MERKRKFGFTNNRLKALKNESGKWETYYDELCPGLTLRISPGGNKSFRFHVWDRLRKQTVTMTIGSWPDTLIETARDFVQKKRQLVLGGEDVKAEAGKIKDELTLNQLFDIWLEDYAKQGNISDWKDAKSKYDMHIKPYLGGKRILRIVPADITAWRSTLLRKKKDRGDGTLSRGFVQRVFTMLSSIYSNGAPRTYNPCRDVTGYESSKRENFLKSDELKRFFVHLENKKTPAYLRDMLILALATGARRSNVLAMRWSDIDLNLKLWIIRGAEAKGKQSIPVPLIDQAVNILESRKKVANSIFVFPSKKSKTGHIVEPKRAWKSFLKDAGLPLDYRFHDIRRTMGSWQAISGTSTNIIGQSLGHRSKQATEHYAHLTLDPVRAAMQRAYDKMEESKVAPEKVVKMGKK